MGWLDMIFLVSAILIVQHLNLNSAQPLAYRDHFCGGGNYTNTSTYASNVNLLLSSLSSNAPGNRGYYNESIGQNRDTVNGLFLCRGDVSPQDCQTCVKASGRDLNSHCINTTGAIIWYDYCMLRYSNESFFSVMELNPGRAVANTAHVSDPLQFNQTLGSLMDFLINKAVYGTTTTTATVSVTHTSTPMFATGEAKLTNFQDYIYGLVQCTRDISQSDCLKCLRDVVSNFRLCCDEKKGGFVYRPSCNSRFETYPFYQFEALPPPSSINTNTPDGSGGKSSSNVVIVVPTIIGVLLLSAFCAYLLRRKKGTKPKTYTIGKDEIGIADSLQFGLDTIRTATNNFSDENKLGEGGFGAVYKGELVVGQEIAVKRLSRYSGQGSQEFKNEVALLHKLQHRNLVRLLGFCLEGEEKLLIYEYVPNRSLDKYLFDPNKRAYLDWERRYKIIRGIARGLLYLHEDSRLRIIHRDLKAGNILLDGEMNAKISDFGMAKLFLVNQTQGSTSRIAGTFGYMAPEYALHGLFSVKSDVFSFGVLLLEIVSSQKINSFHRSGPSRDLLSYTWKHWREGTALELMDPTLANNFSTNEVMRCIHIGLLCVQENIDDRPTMSSVVLMLSSYSVTIASPSPPPFFSESRTGPDVPQRDSELDLSTSNSMTFSGSGVSLPR